MLWHRSLARAAVAVFSALAIPASSAAQPRPATQPDGWDADVRLREAIRPEHRPGDCRSPSRRAAWRRWKSRQAAASTPGPTMAAFPGPLIRARGRRPARRRFHQSRFPSHDGALAWPAGPDPDGRRAGRLSIRGAARRIVHVWLHPARRRTLLVPPACESATQVGFGLYGALLVEDPGGERSVCETRSSSC